MNSKNKKLSIDVDSLNVDWGRQRAEINRKISEKKQVRNVFYWLVPIATTAVVILFLLIHSHTTVPTVENDNFAYLDIDDMVEVEIPEVLYVMNGYGSEEYDFDNTANYILAEEGDLQ